MIYPFLTKNELVLIDYVPGSSGQLLLRLWAELDSKLSYDNDRILTDQGTSDESASREVDYDILIPKKTTNWFLDKCEPDLSEFKVYFELLGTMILASSERWVKYAGAPRFYPNKHYIMEDRRVLYGLHSWDKVIPFDTMIDDGFRLRPISIVPTTEIGLRYQYERAQACYPGSSDGWQRSIAAFNSKQHQQQIDFCTMVATKDTACIVSWLTEAIGPTVRYDKIPRIHKILEEYYASIVDNLEMLHV